MNSLCGIRLSTVAMVVGWMSFIGSTFLTVILCVAFVRLDDVVKMVVDNLNDASDDATIRTAVIVTLAVYLTSNVINVIAACLLIAGTVKERHLLLTPWLINAYIFIFFNALHFIYTVYISIAMGLPVGTTIFALIGSALSLAIQCIIWNAIYSLFKEIRANRDLQQRLLPTTSSTRYTNYSKMPATVE